MLALCFLMKLVEIVRGMMLALCFLIKLDEIVIDGGMSVNSLCSTHQFS